MLFLAKPQSIELSLELAAVHHCRKRRILNSLRSRPPDPLGFHSHLHLLAIVAHRLLPAATGLVILDARRGGWRTLSFPGWWLRSRESPNHTQGGTGPLYLYLS